MQNLKISVLDVGHGDFIYAQTPLGDNIVIDCGSGDVVPSQLLARISQISELQISHPHTDHFDDIVSLSKKKLLSFRCPELDKFSDGVIGRGEKDREKIKKLRELKNNVSTNNNAISISSNFDYKVWYPKNVDYNDPNSSSIVTIIRYNSFKMLFGGDLIAEGWESLLQDKKFIEAIKGTTVFKVPHHGRKNGCCKALFDVISPKLCIISDKPIEKDNENTVATSWYTERSLGCNVVDSSDKVYVLTTRANGSVFIKVDSNGNWTVHKNTRWINET